MINHTLVVSVVIGTTASPIQAVTIVKSHSMRAHRPRRDDGRIDYTKLAQGQGRVKVNNVDINL